MMSSLLPLSSLDALHCVKREINKIEQNFLTLRLSCSSSDSTNFQKTIQPAYKGHRNRKKPCGYQRVINQLKTEYRGYHHANPRS